MLLKQTENSLIGTTAWCCHTCSAHWLSEPAGADQTWYLYELVEPVGVCLPGSAPAWTVSSPDPTVCPTCGGRMMPDNRMPQAALN
jgi:hypothetical protein